MTKWIQKSKISIILKPTGDIIYHPSKIVYYGESTPAKYAHIGIVYDVNLDNGTITIIHSTGGNPGVHYSVLNLKTGLYDSGGAHSFTSILRMSEMEERGYLNWKY